MDGKQAVGTCLCLHYRELRSVRPSLEMSLADRAFLPKGELISGVITNSTLWDSVKEGSWTLLRIWFASLIISLTCVTSATQQAIALYRVSSVDLLSLMEVTLAREEELLRCMCGKCQLCCWMSASCSLRLSWVFLSRSGSIRPEILLWITTWRYVDKKCITWCLVWPVFNLSWNFRECWGPLCIVQLRFGFSIYLPITTLQRPREQAWTARTCRRDRYLLLDNVELKSGSILKCQPDQGIKSMQIRWV